MEGRAIRNGSGWWIVTIINAKFKQYEKDKIYPVGFNSFYDAGFIG